jgi:apoptosis-inducing factor 3
MLLGHAAGEPVLLARSGREVFAIGAECTHYHGPLAEGLRVGDTIRCPWHHACFSLRTGEALHAPAVDPVACWRVELRNGMIFVHDKLAPARGAAQKAKRGQPESVVIIGGGAAGQAAAEMLRREGYIGPVTMLSAENERPYDRPNLSKDYLAGNAPEEWLPLRPTEFYPGHEIVLALGVRAVAIDAKAREIQLADGTRHPWGALLLATGAEPIRLGIPGAELPHVHTLRSARLPRTDRRQLHRARSRGVFAGARARRRCRGARHTPDGSRIRGRDRRPRAPGPRAARRAVSSRYERRGYRRTGRQPT